MKDADVMSSFVSYNVSQVTSTNSCKNSHLTLQHSKHCYYELLGLFEILQPSANGT